MKTRSKLTVRYAETDQMGIVHHSNYYVWFELGRTDYCKAAGFTYTDMEKLDSLRLVVAESSCRYRLPALYEDELVVETTVEKLGSRGMTFSYRILRDGEVLAIGSTKHIVTDSNGKTTRLPKKYIDLMNGEN